MLTRNHFTSEPKVQLISLVYSQQCGKHRFSDLKLYAIKKPSIIDSGDL